MVSPRVVGILSCLALSACSHVQSESTRPTDGPVTLTIGFPFIAGQNSASGIQPASRLIMLEGLVAIGRDGRASPRLAESWTVSPDGTTWTFQLRPKAVFHDGSPVDAESVKASLTRTLASPARDFSPGLLDIVAIETPAPDQVVIRMKTRSAFLLDDLTVSITKRSATGQMIGTGPYVTSATSPTELTMKSFPAYYSRTPTVQQIAWKSYSTPRTAWAAMMRGEIDLLYEVAPDALDFMRDEASVEDFSFLRNYAHGVIFNNRRPMFADSRVRRALNYGIDRAAIINGAFKGHGTPAYTPTWPLHWAYDSTLPVYNYDPARAAALLDSVGFPLAASTKADPARPPARMHFSCLLVTNFPLWERMALIIQRNLSQVGVDMQLEPVSISEFGSRVSSGNFDAALTDLSVGNATSRPYFFWYSTSKQNTWGYGNEMVDQALDRLRYAADDNATRTAFRDLQSQFLDDPPGAFVAFGETTRAVSRRFQPVTPPGGDVFRTIAEWQLAGPVRRRDSN